MSKQYNDDNTTEYDYGDTTTKPNPKPNPNPKLKQYKNGALETQIVDAAGTARRSIDDRTEISLGYSTNFAVRSTGEGALEERPKRFW
jgi:hypothetical protein